MDLATTSNLLRLLADPTRVRLLSILRHEELTVAELSAILHLAQPRVSTHLAKLREACLVHDRRAGVSAYYRLNAEPNQNLAPLLALITDGIDDAVLQRDLDQLPTVLSSRAHKQGWADTVAGDMERHYSPGRTWETLARALLQLLETGDVLDIASGDGVLAELLAPHAHSVTCIDSSERVVEAARLRLRKFDNVKVLQADMHDPDFGEQRFDLVVMMHALTYTSRPTVALRAASDLLRPAGRLLVATLAEHAHRAAVAPFDHRNLGVRPAELSQMVRRAGLDVLHCDTISRERKAPHFEVISLLARKS